MESITTNEYEIHFNATCYTQLKGYLEEGDFSKIFIIVDTNTHESCLAKFLSNLDSPKPLEIIEIEAGEEHKTIDTCVGVWNALSELEADRKSLVINFILKLYLDNNNYEEVAVFLDNCGFPEEKNNNEIVKYLYYSALIKAMEGNYIEANFKANLV